MEYGELYTEVLERIYRLYHGRSNLYDKIRPMAVDRYDRLVVECNNNQYFVYNSTSNSPGYMWDYCFGMVGGYDASLTTLPLGGYGTIPDVQQRAMKAQRTSELCCDISAVSNYFFLYQGGMSWPDLSIKANPMLIGGFLPEHVDYVEYFVNYMENCGFVRLPVELVLCPVPRIEIDDTEHPDIFKCLFSYTGVW